MTKQRLALGGAGALFGAAFIYATFGPLIREMAHMFSDLAQTAARFVLAGAIVAVIVWLQRRPLRLPRRPALYAAGLGMAGAVIISLFTVAVNTTTIAGSVAMIYAGSIVSSLFIGRAFFKEKFTGAKIVAIILAICGLLTYSQTLGLLSLGLLVAVVAGIVDGMANGLRKMLGSVDKMVVLTYQFGVGSAILLIATLLYPEPAIRSVSLLPILATVLFGILQVLLNSLLLYGFKRFDVNIGAVILASELGFATLFGWLLFAEVPSTAELVGLMLICAASIAAALNWQSFAPVRKRRDP